MQMAVDWKFSNSSQSDDRSRLSLVNCQKRHRAKESLILLASHEGIGFGFGFGFTTPFGWLVYLLWFWFYDSQVKTALTGYVLYIYIFQSWLAIGYFDLYLHCMHCLSLVCLNWLLTQHCYNSHINRSASFCGFRQLGWTNYSIRLTTQGKPWTSVHAL